MIKLSRPQSLVFVLAATFVLAGCDNGDGQRKPGMQQTGMAGHVTAGGGTSGEVINHAKQVTRSTAPAGTPGIPQGAGGNTSGAALGGTTTGAQQPDKAEQMLADSMQAVAARWRSNAAASGWQVNLPTPVDAKEGFNASETQSGASGQPGGRLGSEAGQAPLSEKSGTAVPSTDVKDDSKRAAPTGVGAQAPDQVNR